MRWCCPGFEGLYTAAGLRGFAIVVGRDTDGRVVFVLQHRSVDKGTEVPTDYKPSFYVLSERQIRFCQHCGRRLARFYRRHIESLLRPQFWEGLTIIEAEDKNA